MDEDPQSSRYYHHRMWGIATGLSAAGTAGYNAYSTATMLGLRQKQKWVWSDVAELKKYWYPSRPTYGPSTEAAFFETLGKKTGDLTTIETHHAITTYDKFYAPDAPGYSKAEIAANEPEWLNGTKVSKDVMVASVEPTRKAHANRSAAQQLWFS